MSKNLAFKIGVLTFNSDFVCKDSLWNWPFLLFVLYVVKIFYFSEPRTESNIKISDDVRLSSTQDHNKYDMLTLN